METVRRLLFHFDRGIQYCSSGFREASLAALSMLVRSMSRKGNCWDKASSESFFKTLNRNWKNSQERQPGIRSMQRCSNTSKRTTIRTGFTRGTASGRKRQYNGERLNKISTEAGEVQPESSCLRGSGFPKPKKGSGLRR